MPGAWPPDGLVGGKGLTGGGTCGEAPKGGEVDGPPNGSGAPVVGAGENGDGTGVNGGAGVNGWGGVGGGGEIGGVVGLTPVGAAGAAVLAIGTCMRAWHLGQRALLPALPSGTRKSWLHCPQRNSIAIGVTCHCISLIASIITVPRTAARPRQQIRQKAAGSNTAMVALPPLIWCVLENAWIKTAMP